LVAGRVVRFSSLDMMGIQTPIFQRMQWKYHTLIAGGTVFVFMIQLLSTALPFVMERVGRLMINCGPHPIHSQTHYLRPESIPAAFTHLKKSADPFVYGYLADVSFLIDYR